MRILTEPKTTINQNNIHIYNNVNYTQNISTHLSTTKNNVNTLFGISLFQNQIHEVPSSGDSALHSTYSPTLKSEEQSHYDTFQSKPKPNFLKEKTWGKSEFYVEVLENYLTFPKSEKKIHSTWVDFDDLSNLSPIVLQQDLVPRDEKISLRQTSQKPRLDDILLNIPQKFDISNIVKLKSFILTPTILEIPNLPERLDKIICHVSSFMHKLGYDGKSKIDVFSDEEIENFQSIIIEYAVKNATSDQCIKWTESLVSEIIVIDENMLDIIQVEIIPDDI